VKFRRLVKDVIWLNVYHGTCSAVLSQPYTEIINANPPPSLQEIAQEMAIRPPEKKEFPEACTFLLHFNGI